MLTANNVRAITWLFNEMKGQRNFLSGVREVVIWVGKGPTLVIVEESNPRPGDTVPRRGITRIF